MKNIERFFTKNVYYNALSNLVLGLGIGALITNSIINPHPLRYGLVIVLIALLLYAYAYYKK